MTAQPPRRQVERHTEQQGPNRGQPQHPPIDRPFDARHSRLRQPQPHQWPRSRPGSNPRQRRPKERMHHRIDQRTPKERIEQFSAQQARSRGHARAFHRDRRQQRRSLPRPQPSIHRLNRSPVIHTDLITQISAVHADQRLVNLCRRVILEVPCLIKLACTVGATSVAILARIPRRSTITGIVRRGGIAHDPKQPATNQHREPAMTSHMASFCSNVFKWNVFEWRC